MKAKTKSINEVESPNAASYCHQTRDMSRKAKLLHGRCKVLYTRLGRGASRYRSGADLFLRLGLDIVGEPCLEVGTCGSAIVLVSVKQDREGDLPGLQKYRFRLSPH